VSWPARGGLIDLIVRYARNRVLVVVGGNRRARPTQPPAQPTPSQQHQKDVDGADMEIWYGDSTEEKENHSGFQLLSPFLSGNAGSVMTDFNLSREMFGAVSLDLLPSDSALEGYPKTVRICVVGGSDTKYERADSMETLDIVVDRFGDSHAADSMMISAIQPPCEAVAAVAAAGSGAGGEDNKASPPTSQSRAWIIQSKHHNSRFTRIQGGSFIDPLRAVYYIYGGGAAQNDPRTRHIHGEWLQLSRFAGGGVAVVPDTTASSPSNSDATAPPVSASATAGITADEKDKPLLVPPTYFPAAASASASGPATSAAAASSASASLSYWKLLESTDSHMRVRGRSHFVTCVHDGYAYFAGGIFDTSNRQPRSNPVTGIVDRFNLQTQTISMRASMPHDRFSSCGAVAIPTGTKPPPPMTLQEDCWLPGDSVWFVFSGICIQTNQLTFRVDIEMFNFRTNRWFTFQPRTEADAQTLNEMRYVDQTAITSVDDNAIYIFGGTPGRMDVNEQATTDVWRFDLTTYSFNTLSAPHNPPLSAATAAVNAVNAGHKPLVAPHLNVKRCAAHAFLL